MVTTQLSLTRPYFSFQAFQKNRGHIAAQHEKTLHKWIQRLLWFQCLGFVMKHLYNNVTLVTIGNDQKSSTTNREGQHFNHYWNFISMSVWVLFIVWLLSTWVIMRQPFLWRLMDYCHVEEEPLKKLSSGLNSLLERSKENANNVVSIYEHISFRNVFMSVQQSLSSITFRNHTDNDDDDDDNNNNIDNNNDTAPLVEQWPPLGENNVRSDMDPGISHASSMVLGRSTPMIGNQGPINSTSPLMLSPLKHATMTAPCPNLIDRNDDEWQGHQEAINDHREHDLEWFGSGSATGRRKRIL